MRSRSGRNAPRPEDLRAARSAAGRERLVAGLLLVAATCAVYAPLRHAAFINYDDTRYVLDNPDVKQGISMPSVRWALTATRASNWHPLTWLSHMLDWELFGDDARGHHLTSLALHAANALLLFALLDALTRSPGRSFVVAALFAVHPLHVESVAWIAERKDVLSTLFWLLCTMAYVRWVRTPSRSGYVPVAACMAAGLMCKPTLVTLPFTLLLLDLWPLGRWSTKAPRSLRSPIVEKAPLFLLTLASCIVTFLVQRAGGAVANLTSRTLADRGERAVLSYVTYLKLTLWPAGLSVFHPWPTERGALALLPMLAALLLAGVTLAAWRARDSRPYLLVGWLWYLGTLVPMIGIVQVGEQAFAERYTYVPLIGIFVMLVWGAGDALEARAAGTSRPAGAAAALWLLLLMAVAHGYVQQWRDSRTLFTHALTVTEENHVAHQSLGVALGEMGRTEEALAHFREAVRIRPDRREMLMNVAVALHTSRRIEEALPYYERVLRIAPDDPKAHAMLGLGLAELKRWSEAQPHLAEAIRLKPDDAASRNNLGKVLVALGRQDEAVAAFREAVRLDPANADAHLSLGRTLAKSGRREEALESFARAIAADPGVPEAHQNMGLALAGLSRFAEALARYDEAIRLRPDYALAHSNRATALYELQRYDEAWREVLIARKLGHEPPARLVEELSSRSAPPGSP